MENFEGLGISILITAETTYLLEKVCHDFIAQSDLPKGGTDASLNHHLPPEKTPDHRVGRVCSIWVKDISISSVKRLEKYLCQ